MLAIERFQSFIKENDLLNTGSKVLLAVSGGKDSVLMAFFFKASEIDFGIAHCNFKLRGRESDDDEFFVKDLAVQLNVPFYTVSFDTSVIAKRDHISIQMAARELRYSWLDEIRESNNYSAIAVAHHKNDSVETILLNLVRGTGIAGLHGIIPKRGNLIRPLLFLDREEIDSIIQKEKIPYREDSSNASSKYARNKIRLEVIPKLKELNPRLEETFEENSRRFSEIEEYFQEQMTVLRTENFIRQPSGDYHILLSKLKKLKPVRTLLFELFRPYNFNENVLEDLVSTWNGIPGKIFESATHILLLDREKLILKKKIKTSLDDTLVFEKDNMARFGDYTVTWGKTSAAGLQINNTPGKAYIDEMLLIYPLKFRSWKQGDSFYPLGMKGKKKLSDFFINKKVPLTEKQAIPILENGNGDIIWIAGYQTDNRYKVTQQSEKVIIFGLQI